MNQSRRGFLKSLSAAVCVPLINLRPAIPAEQLMMAFCETESFRWDLTKPFGVGSLTYATDRYAMIRAELANRNEVGERRIPRVGPVWDHYWNPVGQWIPLDGSMLIPTITTDHSPCPACGNARVSFGDSYPDHTDAIHMEIVRTYDWDVDDNTIRDNSCQTCHGLHWEGPNASDVLGVRHNAFMLKRIAALPNAIVCRSGNDQDVILFRADGFEGMSLGIRKED